MTFIVGRVYLGYMAMPWTCVGVDPIAGAVFRFGYPGFESGDVTWLTPTMRASLVPGSPLP